MNPHFDGSSIFLNGHTWAIQGHSIFSGTPIERDNSGIYESMIYRDRGSNRKKQREIHHHYFRWISLFLYFVGLHRVTRMYVIYIYMYTCIHVLYTNINILFFDVLLQYGFIKLYFGTFLILVFYPFIFHYILLYCLHFLYV